MLDKKGKVVFGNSEHPWLDPLWRRIALVAVCCVWTGVEFYHDNHTWAAIAGAITAYAVWTHLVSYKPQDGIPPNTRTDLDKSD